LLLSLNHGENYETLTQSLGRNTSASIRWNFSSIAFVEGSYSLLDQEALQITTHSQSLGARLVVSL
jgi:hypothetical protein